MKRIYPNHFKEIKNSEYEHWNKLLMQRIKILAKHENKNSYSGINMYESYATMDFIFMPTTGFIKMCEYYDEYFEKIDKTDANTIVDSYWSQFILNLQDKTQFLSQEKCAYFIKPNGQEIDRVLRLDLFRYIKPKDGRDEFGSGLFHILKHFSLNGVNYSYGNDISESFDIRHIAYLAACAFCQPLTQLKNDKPQFESTLEVGNKTYKAYFYYESESDIYFLNSFRRAHS